VAVRSRRAAREAALKVLYGCEVGKQECEAAIEHVLAEAELDQESQEFVRELVRGVLEKQQEIDVRIEGLSHDWALQRQACVDRNVMRIAVFELLYCPGIPSAATINEAVELVKKYSTADSGRFVNGVLGALADALEAGSSA
jgi:N utilization substance protein B